MTENLVSIEDIYKPTYKAFAGIGCSKFLLCNPQRITLSQQDNISLLFLKTHGGVESNLTINYIDFHQPTDVNNLNVSRNMTSLTIMALSVSAIALLGGIAIARLFP